MKTAILTIVLFCIMIFPHELGHFLAAKKMGVQVNEFAFGMGPTIWKKQRGETLHSIRLFPIGGFCAMEGEDEDSDNPRAFGRKKPWQRIVILAAGSFMNLVCALVISWVLVGMMGFTTTTIGEVAADSPAICRQVLRQGTRSCVSMRQRSRRGMMSARQSRQLRASRCRLRCSPMGGA